ncbi:MAG TPA: sulfatase-like hydrolase/transferase [Solirubrobacteraceae bacterium]|jgi:arylsulfatase A-like enzyme
MPDRPNVVFMLADNLGYGDVGCFGSAGEQRGMPTPNLDRLADGGLRLNQFLVEAACTPSRAALLTGRYSIRTGLSLITVPGGHELGADEFTLGDLFKRAGYRTIYYGKWHLGASTETEPQYHGFDEWRLGFYGSSDGTLYGDNISRTHGPAALHDRNVIQIREADTPRTPSTELHPYDLAYRRKIDNAMTDAAIDYITGNASSDTPFFLFMGITRPHYPNLPSDEFLGASRIGNYGDCIMELDHNVGRILDAIDTAQITQDTIVVFVSDNGPTTTSTLPDEIFMASAGPWRGELGDPWEGSIRTVGMLRWPGHITPGVSEQMVAIMDLLPTFATLLDTDLPDDRPIDGVDQSAHLFNGQTQSNRDHLLTFIGGALTAVRWHQWRIYTANYHPSSTNPSLGGYMGHSNPTAGYPMAFNIEADPREQRNVMAENGWVIDPFMQHVGAYRASLKNHPNPPAANLTDF